MQKPIIYQMLPRLWGNVEGRNLKNGTLLENGTGKFSSVDKESLAYLKWLGCSHVWYTGIIRHSTRQLPDNKTGELKEDSKAQIVKGNAGSPYAIKDYFDVNPYLADNAGRRMQEFQSLVNRTHAAGLKVIIDFVPNHVARDYGQTVRKSMAEYVLGKDDDKNVHWCADNDFYYYPGEHLVLPDNDRFAPEDRYTEYPAKATGNVFTSQPSVNDWYETVKINYCDFHTKTWDKMAEIIRFWAGKGVDGFRCDMVELVPPEFFQWLIPTVKQEFPELIFIAEVYDKTRYGKYINEVGFDYLYDKSGLYDTVRAIVEGHGSATGITANWQYLSGLQPNMLCFLENHDEQRFASDFFGRDARHSYAALYASLFLNQAPFMLYSGEEVGERGMDEEGFSGRDGRTTIFDWWSPRSMRLLHQIVHTPGFDTDRSDLSPEEKEVFRRYSKALKTAAGSEAIQSGQTYDLCWCNRSAEGFDKDRHFVFLRHAEKGETLLIGCNFSDHEASFLTEIPEHAVEYLHLDAAAVQQYRCADGKIRICMELKPFDGKVITL